MRREGGRSMGALLAAVVRAKDTATVKTGGGGGLSAASVQVCEGGGAAVAQHKLPLPLPRICPGLPSYAPLTGTWSSRGGRVAMCRLCLQRRPPLHRLRLTARCSETQWVQDWGRTHAQTVVRVTVLVEGGGRAAEVTAAPSNTIPPPPPHRPAPCTGHVQAPVCEVALGEARTRVSRQSPFHPDRTRFAGRVRCAHAWSCLVTRYVLSKRRSCAPPQFRHGKRGDDGRLVGATTVHAVSCAMGPHRPALSHDTCQPVLDPLARRSDTAAWPAGTGHARAMQARSRRRHRRD
jgi:hypothetical protein